MSIILKGIDLPKEGESYIVELKPYEAVTFKRGEKIKLMQRQVYEAIQIDQPWKECSCYQCKHRGTAPYEKPCSVCARNHKDYFEEI